VPQKWHSAPPWGRRVISSCGDPAWTGSRYRFGPTTKLARPGHARRLKPPEVLGMAAGSSPCLAWRRQIDAAVKVYGCSGPRTRSRMRNTATP